jgi:hypothetical protein
MCGVRYRSRLIHCVSSLSTALAWCFWQVGQVNVAVQLLQVGHMGVKMSKGAGVGSCILIVVYTVKIES